MCVLMVCFNVLELLLDETAMPRGMEVRKELVKISCLSSVHISDYAFFFGVCVLGPTPWDGLFLHVWLTGCYSSSSPDPVSFHPVHVCVHSYLVMLI